MDPKAIPNVVSYVYGIKWREKIVIFIFSSNSWNCSKTYSFFFFLKVNETPTYFALYSFFNVRYCK
jgi:hypothetical protein